MIWEQLPGVVLGTGLGLVLGVLILRVRRWVAKRRLLRARARTVEFLGDVYKGRPEAEIIKAPKEVKR